MLEHIRSLKRTIDSNLKNQLADIALAPRYRCHCHTGTSVPRSRHNTPSLLFSLTIQLTTLVVRETRLPLGCANMGVLAINSKYLTINPGQIFIFHPYMRTFIKSVDLASTHLFLSQHWWH
uniref:Uncharacterized protein n=1 Tax=Zea mays TaxID=4577 RepID=C0PJU7_MAIZE|nr:unknown [Zea mays]